MIVRNGRNRKKGIWAHHCPNLNGCSFIFLRSGGASSAANEEFWINYLRNMAIVFWKVIYTSTLDEGQFKEKLLEALEFRLEKVTH